MDFDALRGHVREIEEVLDRSAAGRENKDALTAIKRESSTIRQNCDRNTAIIETANSVELFADTLYGGRRVGLLKSYGDIKEVMRHSIANLRFHISRLERIAELPSKTGTE